MQEVGIRRRHLDPYFLRENLLGLLCPASSIWMKYEGLQVTSQTPKINNVLINIFAEINESCC